MLTVIYYQLNYTKRISPSQILSLIELMNIRYFQFELHYQSFMAAIVVRTA